MRKVNFSKDQIFVRAAAFIMSLSMVMLLSCGLTAVPVWADDSYTVEQEADDYVLCKNRDSGYEILIDDSADLFTESEENDLIPYMIACSDGGFVMLVTIDDNKYNDAYDFCHSYYRSKIPEESGIMFLIDMDTRELRFYSEGSYHRQLTKDVMNIISDNVYKQAHNGDYYACASEAFAEIADVLEGKKIAAPMKYVSNACLAILLGLIINYFFARGVSKAVKPSNSEILKSIFSAFEFRNPTVTFTHQTKTYSPRSSGSGGGGGGGGGGHSSGGHSF
ncbi:MAG: TPM domain-containing protein [Lachnospiraceae bacterium]|nr:TPM domain-containing protein [Lachnospiraceae bacterium]